MLLNYNDIIQEHNDRKNLNQWIAHIYRYFWNEPASETSEHGNFKSSGQIIDEIQMKDSYYDNILGEERKLYKVISGSEFRYCIKFIRTNILYRKITFFSKQLMDKEFNVINIPDSYIKSLYWIIANKKGYAKTYDYSLMRKHRSALVSRYHSLGKDIRTIDYLVRILETKESAEYFTR